MRGLGREGWWQVLTGHVVGKATVGEVTGTGTPEVSSRLSFHLVTKFGQVQEAMRAGLVPCHPRELCTVTIWLRVLPGLCP